MTSAPVPSIGRTRVYSDIPKLGRSDLSAFLPPKSDPDYLWILAELVRSELEYHRMIESPIRLDDFRSDYPELFTDAEIMRALSGESASDKPVNTPPPIGVLDLTRSVPIQPVVSALVEEAIRPPSTKCPVIISTGVRTDFEELFSDFPSVGQQFQGFQLREELGSGAFAKVFLAEQIGLANRPVALKVSNRPTKEPQRLAKLHHTNIVPIFSVHETNGLQGVCMPYLGRQTLADLVSAYKETGSFPLTSIHVASTAAIAANSTVRSKRRHQSNPELPATTKLDVTNPTVPAAIAGKTHAELVVWLLQRMAEGLAHAHEVGILHLDLKPANVLFADDGQPLLLDFNLGFDVRTGDRERAGGTLPYMAPEQLEEYRDGGPTRVDQRTDLYALGAIVFELLTGRQPYPVKPEQAKDLTQLLEARRTHVGSLRKLNPDVSPALDALVRKLLEPDPANRYQSAHELVTDLARHSDNLPLLHGPNPCLRERVRKWHRRNPRLWIVGIVAGLVLLAGGLTATAVWKHESAAAASAKEQARAADLDLSRLRVDLVVRDDAKVRRSAIEQARQLLASYGLPENPNWHLQPVVHRLTPKERELLTEDLYELTKLLAVALRLEANRKTSSDEQSIVEEADRLDKLAATFPVTSGTTNADLYLAAVGRIVDAKYSEAILSLETIADRSPDHFAAQFQLGICRQYTGDNPRALERYRMAAALAPSDPRPVFNRGVVLLFLGKLNEAESAFDEAIRRDSTHAATYYNRALAKRLRNEHTGAIADLTLALENGSPPIQARLMRAESLVKIGKIEDAKADREAVKLLEPSDPMDFVARGRSKLPADPAGALSDFAAAANQNPNYTVAWQNQAHVLADWLHESEKALSMQDKAVATAPELATARAGRAVLYARLGKRTEAHDDANKALLLSSDPNITYQAGCVYALTCTTNPEDRPRAMELIRKALRDGYRDFANLDRDPDLKSLRNLPEFREVVKAARELRK